ncbi:MAG: Gfo/Idh/MocA family protein, partial [Bryobacteraceae bacterium]
MTDFVRVGIIGAGGAARAIHAPGFRLYPGVGIAAVCDSDAAAADALASELGAQVHTRYDQLLARGDVDAVVIATPNHLHREVALAAFDAGKHVLCEKPLALDRRQAEDMLRAAEASGRVHMTAFTYRFVPALQYIRSLIERGELGTIRTVRAAYLMALSRHLLGWRSSRKFAGSGVLADVGSHLIHMVQLLAGGLKEVCASKRRFREDPASDVDDWIAFLAGFESGACGTFEISRVCAGRGAAITEEIFIEVYGSGGTALFSLQDPWGVRLVTGQAADDPACVIERRDV